MVIVRQRRMTSIVGLLVAMLVALGGAGCEPRKEYTRHYWPDGALKGEGVLLAGGMLSDKAFHGPWIYYYPSGEKWKEGRWDFNTRVGVWRIYHRDGALLAEGELRGTARVGEWKWWYPNGQLAAEGSFSRQEYSNETGHRGGYASGPWVFFYDTGQLAARGDYLPPPPEEVDDPWAYNDFVRHHELDDAGEWELESLGNHAGGLATGDWVMFEPNGDPSPLSGTYENGLRAR